MQTTGANPGIARQFHRDHMLPETALPRSRSGVRRGKAVAWLGTGTSQCPRTDRPKPGTASRSGLCRSPRQGCFRPRYRHGSGMCVRSRAHGLWGAAARAVLVYQRCRRLEYARHVQPGPDCHCSHPALGPKHQACVVHSANQRHSQAFLATVIRERDRRTPNGLYHVFLSHAGEEQIRLAQGCVSIALRVPGRCETADCAVLRDTASEPCHRCHPVLSRPDLFARHTTFETLRRAEQSHGRADRRPDQKGGGLGQAGVSPMQLASRICQGLNCLARQIKFRL